MNAGDRFGWYGMSWRRVLVLLGTVAAVVGIAGGLLYTPAHPAYMYVGPGTAYDTGRMITVDGQHKPLAGHLLMLTVTAEPANLFLRLYSRLDHRARLEPASAFLGGYPSYDAYVEDGAALMQDSQNTAVVVAEQAAGLPARIEKQGALVRRVVPDGPAAAWLKNGDVIFKLGSTPVYSLDDLRQALAQYKPGDSIDLTIRRGTDATTATVLTRPNPDDPTKPFLGIVPDDARPKFAIPVPVKFNASAIIGDSGGLMFCLQIISQLQDKDLSHGLLVAGTGTIDAGGLVGPIGSIEQKVYTAEAARALVMFVPREHYAAASKVATRLRVVPVDTLKDALDWLASYGSSSAGSTP